MNDIRPELIPEKHRGIADKDLQVYNRQGALIYDSRSEQDMPWEAVQILLHELERLKL